MHDIIIAADHAGFKLKEEIIHFLKKQSIVTVDLGTFNDNPVDYPNYAFNLAKELKDKINTLGILICGTGIGMSIAANRAKYIRAALCVNAKMAGLSREHNDANVLILGARIIDSKTAIECVKEFLNTDFIGAHHKIRIDKLTGEFHE